MFEKSGNKTIKFCNFHVLITALITIMLKTFFMKALKTTVPLSLLVSVLALMAGCQNSAKPDLAGRYRGVIESPGGELAFPITIAKTDSGYTGYVSNGTDTLSFSDIKAGPDSVSLDFSFYDSHLIAAVQPNGDLRGRWTKHSIGTRILNLPFHAEKGVTYRYPRKSTDAGLFDGKWPTTFTTADSSHSYPATGEFYTDNGKLYGTFLTETGDFRFLQGYAQDSTMTLSTFDGAHVFLFKGHLQKDGTIKGDFWSYTSHDTWTAKKGSNELRNPFAIAKIDPQHPDITFKLPDVNGHMISSNDPQFRGKPILLYIFGTWCPNCADETAMLRQMYSKYKNTDLKIVGVAFEYFDSFKQKAEMVRRYQKRFNIPWTLVIGGKAEANDVLSSLPFVQKLISYPTAYFAGPDHAIKYIHVGFNGPGTGSYYFKEKKAFKEKIDDITK